MAMGPQTINQARSEIQATIGSASQFINGGIKNGIAKVNRSGSSMVSSFEPENDTPQAITRETPEASAENNSSNSISGMIRHLLSWQNPSTTMISIAAVNALFVLFWILSIPLLSLGCIVAIGIMTIGLVTSFVIDSSSTFDQPFVLVSKSRMEDGLPVVYNFITRTGCMGRDIVLWRHFSSSAWATASMVIVGYLASLMRFSIIFFLVMNIICFYRQLETLYEAHLAVYVAGGLSVAHDYWKKIPKMKRERHMKLG